MRERGRVSLGVVAALGSVSREVLHKRPWHVSQWNRWTLADLTFLFRLSRNIQFRMKR